LHQWLVALGQRSGLRQIRFSTRLAGPGTGGGGGTVLPPWPAPWDSKEAAFETTVSGRPGALPGVNAVPPPPAGTTKVASSADDVAGDVGLPEPPVFATNVGSTGARDGVTGATTVGALAPGSVVRAAPGLLSVR